LASTGISRSLPASDPPPDLVLEIDLTTNSLRKFGIYAAFVVPEIWRYDGRKCVFYTLVDGRYIETRTSRFLPRLTGQIIADAVEISKTQGQDKARRAFRRTLRQLKSKLTAR
jgi:Uma2 family endonuclease